MQAMFPSRNPLKQVRRSAVLFLVGSIVLLAGFILHPPEFVDTAQTTQSIHDNADMWMVAHWLLAGGGVLFAAACFMLAAARYGPTRFPAGRRTFIALGMVTVLALEIFVLEATLAVTYGKGLDTKALEGLLAPEIPGIVGLFGLAAVGAWTFIAQARDDCPVLPTGVNWIPALGGLLGLAGDVAFLFGNQALSQLQYGNALLLLGFAAFAIRALLESRPAKQSTEARTEA